jgi:translocation and assembly module TamA
LALIRQTLLDYYKLHGFFHTEIQRQKDDTKIIFTITENSPLEIVTLSYSSLLSLPSSMLFKEGERFEVSRFTQSKKDMKNFYDNRGYCHAVVDAKARIDSDKNEVSLVYQVTPNELCYFGTITLNPLKNIDDKIVASLLEIEESELYSQDAIVKSYENIYAYAGISKVRIQTQIQDNNNSVGVFVSYEANEKPLRFELGLGASSDEGAMAQLALKNRNFLGDLKTLGIQTRVTQIKQNISLFLDVPLAYKNFTGASITYEDERFDAFRESHVNTNFFVKHKYFYHTFKESLLLDRSNTYDVDDGLKDLEKYLFITTLKLEWLFDTRDKLLDPRSGMFFGAEISGSKYSKVSDASYYKTRVLAGAIGSIDEHVFALKSIYATLHLLDGEVPSSYRFFAGGMYSNRAYRYRDLGPSDEQNNPLGSDSMIQVNAEYRYKIYGNFRGVLFSDTTYLGNDTSPDMSNGYYSTGLGLRYKSPIGPIALDFGFDVANPSEFYAFHFHIGELF